MLSEETEPESGVIIFGRKIKGVLSKFYTGLFSIILLPPLLLFTAAIAIGVALLIFPLASIALLSTFPLIILSLIVLVITLPVCGPIIIIYLLFTEKGKLSIWTSNGIIRLRFFKRKQ